jgi:hypothetical protein
MPSVHNSRPSVSIRIATAADVLAAIPLVNAAFAIATFLGGDRTDEIRISEMMQKGEFLVAKEDASGHIVALVYTEKRGDRRGRAPAWDGRWSGQPSNTVGNMAATTWISPC